MKTTLALLTAVISLASFVQAGPSTLGSFFTSPPAKKIVQVAPPTGPQCLMKKTEWLDGHGRGAGSYTATRSVNCIGQKCCAVAAAKPCCATKS